MSTELKQDSILEKIQKFGIDTHDMPYQYFTAAGLVLDFFGALFLAVPDFRWLATKFTFGRLQEVRESIERGGAAKGDVGYRDLQTIISNQEPVADIGTRNVEDSMHYQEFVVDALPGMASVWSRDHDDFRWNAEYLQARYGEQEDFDMIDYYQLSPIYRRIRKRTKPRAAQFRSIGLVLLASGFGVQALAVIFSIIF